MVLKLSEGALSRRDIAAPFVDRCDQRDEPLLTRCELLLRAFELFLALIAGGAGDGQRVLCFLPLLSVERLKHFRQLAAEAVVGNRAIGLAFELA